MRCRRIAILALALAACGNGQPSGGSAAASCTGLCTASHLTRLDLVAGQPGGPGWVDGTLTAAHFSSPWAMARDGNGHIFVADGLTIRTIDTSARTVTTLAGTFDGVGSNATTFNSPSGLAYSDGQLYVADTENSAIRKVDVATGTTSTIAGQIGLPGTVDAVGTASRFNEPEGLGLDANGNLYISDTDNNTVRMLALSTGVVTTIAGMAGSSGATDGVGAAARFKTPRGLVLDGMGNAYVVDGGNLRIRKIALASRTVSTVVTFTTTPIGMAIDGSDLLVTDGSERVVRVAPDGTVTPMAGATGMQGFVDGSPATARFSDPAGLLNDGAGTLYVADDGNAVIRKIALSSGNVSTYAGANSRGSSDGTATQARFSSPQGIATDGETAYVADTHNETIRRVVIATGEVTTIAGAAGQTGKSDGPALSARFDQPTGVALDSANHKLYVSDEYNQAIRVLDLDHGTVGTLALSPAAGGGWTRFDAPQGVAFDRGTLYVVDYSDADVVSVDLEHERASILAGRPGMPGSTDGRGTGAAFDGPVSVAADGRGNLFVADNQNQTVRQIVIATGEVSTIAGQVDIPGDADGTGTGALLDLPTSIAANAAGDLFVSVVVNTVRHVDTRSHAVTTPIGSLTLSGVRPGPLPAQLTQPSAVALTPAGGLLIISENSLLIAH